MKKVLAFVLGLTVGFGIIAVHEYRRAVSDAGSIEVAAQDVPNLDSRAIVILDGVSRQQAAIGSTKWTRVAFAIGDGTLLLTAAHCIDDFQETSKAPVSTDMVVVSPYYGDVFDFQIVAVDEEADLAILKAPWPTHPALPLASEEELAAAERILIASRPQAGQIGPDLGFESLPVITTNAPSPNTAVQLKGTEQVAKGWSGSALVLPETGEVVGVLTRLRIRRRFRLLFGPPRRQDALGCGIASVHALLKERGLESVAAGQPGPLESIPDAQRGFLLAMDYFEALVEHDAGRLIETAQALAQLRPDSVQVHLLAALAATVRADDPRLPRDESLNMVRESYERALQANPNHAHAHAVYGNFLMQQGDREAALSHSEAALQIDPNDRLALLNRMALLPSDQTRETAERLIAIDPNDPYYWFYYSTSLIHLHEHEEALAAAQKAVDLDPNGTFYGGLALALQALDRLDEAEECFELMTRRCACQSCWYNYAAFLTQHRPEKLDTALKALDAAQAKANMGRVSQKDMDDLRVTLLEKISPERTETFLRKRLDADPNDARAWWNLASILRTQERYEAAAEAAGKAVELDPSADYRARLANCLAKTGDLDGAQRVYDEMFERHPERALYWYWYAQFLLDYYPDRTEEAQTALKNAEDTTDADWSVPPEDLDGLKARLETDVALAR